MIRVTSVKPLSGYRLHIRFNDGTEGVYAVDPERRGGIFLKIIPPEIFNAVSINEDFGCVEWPEDVDLCPTAMYEEIFGAPVAQSEQVGAGQQANTAR